MEKVKTIRAHSDRGTKKYLNRIYWMILCCCVVLCCVMFEVIWCFVCVVISACWCSDSNRFLSSSFDLTIRFFNIHGVELCSHIKSIALYDIQSTTAHNATQHHTTQQKTTERNDHSTKHNNTTQHNNTTNNRTQHSTTNGERHTSDSKVMTDVVEYFVCSCSIQHNRVKRFAVKREKRKLKDGTGNTKHNTTQHNTTPYSTSPQPKHKYKPTLLIHTKTQHNATQHNTTYLRARFARRWLCPSILLLAPKLYSRYQK